MTGTLISVDGQFPIEAEAYSSCTLKNCTLYQAYELCSPEYNRKFYAIAICL